MSLFLAGKRKLSHGFSVTILFTVACTGVVVFLCEETPL